MERLSNIELYFTESENISGDNILLTGEELRHVAKVMRHYAGDTIYITNGTGSIFRCEVLSIAKEKLTAKVKDQFNYVNKLKNIYFCIPKLKNPDRLKFAIEKCVELGVVNFIVFNSIRTIARGSNLERWNKIALSAMKQSLRSYLPNIQLINTLGELAALPGEKIIFDQNAESDFRLDKETGMMYYFIFGPEGGFAEEEIKLFENPQFFSLGEYRLRTETAIIKCAALIKS